MPAVKALEFAKHLEQAPPKPVYALVGNDEALTSESIHLIKAAVEKPELPGTLTKELDERPPPSAVFDELRTLPLMGIPGMRLVIVRAADEFIGAHSKAILAYLDRPSRTGVLVLCCKDMDVRSKLAKAIERIGLILDCSTPKWAGAKDWLRTKAHTEGKTFTPAAIDALLVAVGPNLVALRSELEKLILYVGDKTTITERDIEELVPQSRSRSIFELSDAIARADAATVLKLGEGLLLRGESLERIIAFLGRQTRKLARLKRMLATGAREREIGRELNMPAFAIRKSAGRAKILTDEWFARQMRILAAADEELKTTSVQAAEQRVWLSGLLTRLCL